MTPYNNPKVFLANPVRFVYDKEENNYIPYILNGKIPVVFIPGQGYYTNYINHNRPLTIVDINNYNHISTNRYYITNVKSLSRYTDKPISLLKNWDKESIILNKEYGFDNKWYKKQDINLDKRLSYDPSLKPDMKLNEELYVAKMIYKIKKIDYADGELTKDVYLHASNNYGLFSYENGMFVSKLTGYQYDELEQSDLIDQIIGFPLDMEYSYECGISKQELGVAYVYDLHDFITSFHLYIDPNKSIIDQINSYKDLKTDINFRTINDVRKYNDIIDLNYASNESLNKDIMRRTLKK